MKEASCHFCGTSCSNYDYLNSIHYCADCCRSLLSTARYLTYNHVMEALDSRYGISLTVGLYREIVSQIKDRGKDTWICRGDRNSRAIHKVVVGGAKVFVVYKKGASSKLSRQGTIITALPRKCVVNGVLVK